MASVRSMMEFSRANRAAVSKASVLTPELGFSGTSRTASDANWCIGSFSWKWPRNRRIPGLASDSRRRFSSRRFLSVSVWRCGSASQGKTKRSKRKPRSPAARCMDSMVRSKLSASWELAGLGAVAMTKRMLRAGLRQGAPGVRFASRGDWEKAARRAAQRSAVSLCTGREAPAACNCCLASAGVPGLTARWVTPSATSSIALSQPLRFTHTSTRSDDSEITERVVKFVPGALQGRRRYEIARNPQRDASDRETLWRSGFTKRSACSARPAGGI